MTVSVGLLVPLLLLVSATSLALGYTLAVARISVRRSQHNPRQDSQHEETARLQAEAASWRARAEELSTRASLAEERAERDGAVLRALAPVRSQLEQVGARVESLERQRAQQHATLTEQLRETARAERDLQRTTASLEGALRSRSARGMWGEVELARILEASGMMRHVDFAEQRTVGSLVQQRSGRLSSADGASSPPAPSRPEGATSSRPDVVIHLPGEGYLALDAKVPMDSYLEATSLGTTTQQDQDRRAELLAAHARALRSHVDQLASRRYDRALGSSPEVVVLFVPAEPVLAAALETDTSLMEHALGRGVVLASPASLLALLRTCATAWARTAVNDDAQDLLELGRTLYDRLSTLAHHLDDLGRALRRSVTAYNKTLGSLENRLLVTARTLNTLGNDLHSPASIGSDDAQLRSLTATELSTAGRQQKLQESRPQEENRRQDEIQPQDENQQQEGEGDWGEGD
ncbi:DNA recombination protein RmuC [Actinomyces wuliandei]|uniref:DNA recombination protein RmuC n=1 Tax=Actinomyces wuliandei TaxID=2057743 RepID=UPI000FDA0319|nr:DNA recombination protein RmuC [Actinomyces wuliandei]